MNKLIVIFFLALVLAGSGTFIFVKKYPNSPLIPYHPNGPTEQTETNKNDIRTPVRQLDRANDAIRKDIISYLGQALKKYYSTNNKSPENLVVLVTEGLIGEVGVDPITKESPTYIPNDEKRGCRVGLTLSDGSAVNGWCK